MTPAILLTILVAALIAMIPVWRLRNAGWPARWLLATWVALAVGGFLAVRFAGPFRFLIPILVLTFLAPFVAGPERLSRVLGGRPPVRPVVIDVTPRAISRPPAEPVDDHPPQGEGDDPETQP